MHSPCIALIDMSMRGVNKLSYYTIRYDYIHDLLVSWYLPNLSRNHPVTWRQSGIIWPCGISRLHGCLSFVADILNKKDLTVFMISRVGVKHGNFFRGEIFQEFCWWTTGYARKSTFWDKLSLHRGNTKKKSENPRTWRWFWSKKLSLHHDFLVTFISEEE